MDGFLLMAALGTFFLAFGIFNWFHPFLGTLGTDLFVNPEDLDVVRLVLVRVLAVLMTLVGLGLLYVSVYELVQKVPLAYLLIWTFDPARRSRADRKGIPFGRGNGYVVEVNQLDFHPRLALL